MTKITLNSWKKKLFSLNTMISCIILLLMRYIYDVKKFYLYINKWNFFIKKIHSEKIYILAKQMEPKTFQDFLFFIFFAKDISLVFKIQYWTNVFKKIEKNLVLRIIFSKIIILMVYEWHIQEDIQLYREWDKIKDWKIESSQKNMEICLLTLHLVLFKR